MFNSRTSMMSRDTIMSNFQRESMRNTNFISTAKKPMLLRDVDEEVWYELTNGNGGLFQERMDFCNNAYLALKSKKDKFKMESVFDEPDGYDEMNEKEADKFVKMRINNPIYEIDGAVKTSGLLYKTKTSEQHEARLNKYKKIFHSVMLQFTNKSDFNIYDKIRDKIIKENKSCHFLFNMASSSITEYDTWYGEKTPDYLTAMIFEKPHGRLYDYLTKNSDAEMQFFYYNVFFQALIALAQFHRLTGASLRGVTYDNLYYIYSQEHDGLPTEDEPYINSERSPDDMIYYEYYFNNDGAPSYNFCIPALNLVVILHNLEGAVPTASVKDVLKDYDSLIDLFIRKEHGGKMPDELNTKNKGASKTLQSFKSKIIEAFLKQEKEITPSTIAANMVFQFGQKLGLKEIPGVKFYEISPEVTKINEDPFMI